MDRFPLPIMQFLNDCKTTQLIDEQNALYVHLKRTLQRKRIHSSYKCFLFKK